MKPTIDGTKAGSHLGMGLALVTAVVLALALAIAGCTSEPPNLVGTALVTNQIDTILVPLGVETVTGYSALRVENEDVLVHQQELVYLGEQMGTRSSIIANFDFSGEITSRNLTRYPDSLFTVENIKSVKFSLTKPTFYHAYTKVGEGDTSRLDPTGQPVDLYYIIRQLEAPFDSTLYESWPNEVPADLPQILNDDYFEPNEFNEPFLRMYAADFIRWFNEGAPIGLMVQLDAPSDSGLVGFGSRDTKKFSQFDALQVGTLVGPNFQVEFNTDYVDTFQFYLMNSFADASTFDQVPEAPADADTEFLLRTGLRSYPALTFDLTGLPPQAFINRALLTVTNDTTVSFGQLGALSVLEWDESLYGDPYRTTTVTEVSDLSQTYSFYLTGQGGLDPFLDRTIQFDVTQAILRVINNVYVGQRGFLLTGAEDNFPTGLLSPVNPDFYYREFRFLGTGAANPEDRPQLKITYSLVDELQGEGK